MSLQHKYKIIEISVDLMITNTELSVLAREISVKMLPFQQ
jgi:hypothetical protein